VVRDVAALSGTFGDETLGGQTLSEGDDCVIAIAKEVAFGDQDVDRTLALGGIDISQALLKGPQPSAMLIREGIGLKLLDQRCVDEAFGLRLGPAVDVLGGERVIDRTMRNSLTA